MKAVEFLVKKGAKIDEDALFFATTLGRNEMLRLFIKYNVNLHVKFYDGRNLLHWAVQENHIETVKLLIQNNVNINEIEEDAHTPLYMASGDGNYEIAKLLLDNNAQVDLTLNTTPFGIACAFEHYKVASLLLKYKADIDARDTDGRTALFYAKVRNHEMLLKYLLENGANSEITDNFGVSIQSLEDEDIRRKLYDELF